ncbi:PREDICTED: probable xyloglucan endotransglucosylase/hydrolase protein 30 [Nelumbo nucifera]|uniref:Xyloglucan endotransglucosylase/hydrolase n=1 Tax=Nelumbo nucifera TaxID=4432 RepID=A0A1U8A3B3_NELNU|nr:PREDICTED: probable xyloglucan endotransglucosylase/hydrolase protein 30 [Nelumbo nucifera]
MDRLRSSSSLCRSRALSYLCFFLCISCVAATDFNVTTIRFDEGYSPLFGDSNVVRSSDGKSVHLLLDRYTGSGFISSSLYNHGFFSAKIKLPADYTAGVVVAFYTSNGDVFEKTHDELDFEFLGNIHGKEWRFQTNVYGNGSTHRGREERYYLWFDPTREFHRYSILWTANNIIFYVDDVPIRQVVRNDAMGGDYPSKPMSLYATIWDASNWATSGGKYKVNYEYAPFVSHFSDLVLQGCPSDPIQQLPTGSCAEKDAELESADYAVITQERRAAMKNFRQRYMYYSYCYDSLRYPVPPPECVTVPAERRRFKDTGRLKFDSHHHRHSKRPRRVPTGSASNKQAEM